MGLENNANSGIKFVSVTNGRLTIRVPEGTEGAVKRELTAGANKGKLVSELQYGKLTGMITKVAFEEKKFGEFIAITVTDDGINYLLQIPWNSGIKTSILTRLPNVDYSKSVTFSAFSDKTKEKPTNVLLIYQDNELVKTAYSKDAPNGMPEAKQTKVRGVSKWDFSEVEEFLYGVLVEQIEAVKVLNPDAVEAEVQPDAEVKSKLDD